MQERGHLLLPRWIVTCLHSAGSSQQPSRRRQPQNPHPFPANLVNPPLSDATAAVPPLPPAEEEEYTFPPPRYYALHPAAAAQPSAQSITYALSPPSLATDSAAERGGQQQQQHQEFLHRSAAPVYQVPAGSTDVWNSVRWAMASSWERGDGGQLSGVMRWALLEVLEEEERKGKGNKRKGS